LRAQEEEQNRIIEAYHEEMSSSMKIGVTESRDRFKCIEHLTVTTVKIPDILSNADGCPR